MPTPPSTPVAVWRLGGSAGHIRLVPEAFTADGPNTLDVRLDATTTEVAWPVVHPGPLNESTGFREFTVTVTFDLAEVVGEYVLEVGARGGSGPCPDLRVSVNGVAGLLLARQVRENRAHAPMPPSPTAGLVNRTLSIPAGLLAPGENHISFTTITLGEIDETELVPQYRPDLGHWFGSTLAWKSLALVRSARTSPLTIDVEPLPLYVRDGDGVPRELVDVVVDDFGRYGDGVLTVSGAATTRVPLTDFGFEFGDVRFRVDVPDSEAPFELGVTITTSAREVSRTVVCTPARKWTIHLVPHVHMDIGYTDIQSRVMELHSRNIDKALAHIEADPGYRFALDGTYMIEEYTKTRTPARYEQLLGALRDGSIGVNAFYAELLTGVTGLEDMYRALYLAGNLRREQGIPITYANVTDVPSYSSALPSILAAEGIDSFLAMSNHTRGGNADSDELHLLSPVRWTGADGASVLAFFTDIYTQLRFVCGDPATTAGIAQGMVELLRRYERADYLPDHFPLIGTNADNEDLGQGYRDLVERWGASYAWPQIRFSSAEDYFATVRPLLAELPEWRGDGGGYWEDGVGTQALSTATNRMSQATLPAAEAVAALATISADYLAPNVAALDEAWACVILGSEHTWTADISTMHVGSTKEKELLAWTVERIDHGARLVQDELDRALSQLADQIPTTTLPALLVVNTLSWTRDLWVEVEIATTAEILDPAGVPIPHVVLDARDGLKRVRARVPGVPGLGYRMLGLSDFASPMAAVQRSVAPAPRPAPDTDAVVRLATEGTTHYEVTLDAAHGTITSLRHRATGAELLDPTSEWSLGDVLYVSGGGSAEWRGFGDEGSSLQDYDPTLPSAEFTTVAADLTLAEITRGPFGWTIISEGSGPTLARVRREVRLYDEDDRVDVVISFDKEACLARESVYVAFPFLSTADPSIHYDRQQGWINPAVDHYPGACNEWLTVQNAVTVSSPEVSVAWSSAHAPLFSVSDIVRMTWPTRFTAATGHLFSWVMNNYWFTNTAPSQSGNAEFAYSFRPSAAPDFAGAVRLGKELRNRGLASIIPQNDRVEDGARPLAPAGQLLATEAPENTIVSVFAGRGESRLLLRAQETAGAAARVVVRVPEALRGAGAATLVSATEDVIRELAPDDSGRLMLDLEPYQVVSVGLGTR